MAHFLKKNIPINPLRKITLESCHPRFNGYRENVVYYKKDGTPIYKKIIIKCMKCSLITDALYKNNERCINDKHPKKITAVL